MPASQKAKERLNAKRHDDDKPRKDDIFGEGYTWAEFQLEAVTNADQTKVDLAKEDQVWHYLGQTSTDARAQFTEDPALRRHNPKGNFLDTLPKPPKPAKPPKTAVQRPSYGIIAQPYMQHTFVPYTSGVNTYTTLQLTPASSFAMPQQAPVPAQSVYVKYPFFAVHHNRDASSYRSPYAPVFGFSSHALAPAKPPMYTFKPTQYTTPQATPAQKPKPKPVSQLKAYKIPEKQSPVPLPANFLAAFTNSPATPTPKQDTQPTVQSATVTVPPAAAVRPPPPQSDGSLPQQEFADVPGSESMQFVERMMHNIRRMSHGQSG